MIEQNQKVFYSVVALMISASLHLVMWISAEHFEMQSLDRQRTVNPRKTQLDVIDMKVVPRPDETVPSFDLSNIIAQQKEVLRDLFKKEGMVELPQPSHLPRNKKSPTFRLNDMDGGGKKHTTPLSMLPPEFMAVKPRGPELGIREKGPQRIPRIKPNQQFKLVPTNTPKLKGYPRSLVSKTFKTKLNIPQEKSEVIETSAAPPRPELITITKIKTPKEKMKVLDSALTATTKIYQDPKTEESFFYIEITYSDEKPVDPIPKDILFLQDASSSISFSKLGKFKQGLKLGLDYLNSQDGFNIVTFRDKPKPLYSNFAPATQEYLQKTNRFIDTISSSGKTDIYSGLAPYLSATRKTPNRPFLILLVSDGRTTTGLKLKDRELISRIIRENNAGVSIFSFSVGAKANLFLMDFISYMNGGISQHIDKKENSSNRLAQFVAMLSDMIIADLTYKITGNLQAEIYPKQLPHLFRNYPLSLYGKLTPGIDEIAVQIIGKDKNGKKEELIKRISLNTALPAGRELAQRWALQKIYYLLGQSILKSSSEFESEINNLALKYTIDIPY